jgi:hypothetical protein
MVDETMANDPATTQLSIHGTNVVFGNYVKDLNNVSWELITTIESINFVSCGAFGSGFANTPNFDSLIGAVTINSHLKQLS